MNIRIVWKPFIPAPKLEKYCFLSNDAQIVMSAIYRQYNESKQRREMLQEAYSGNSTSSYYKDIYNRKFRPVRVKTESADYNDKTQYRTMQNLNQPCMPHEFSQTLDRRQNTSLLQSKPNREMSQLSYRQKYPEQTQTGIPHAVLLPSMDNHQKYQEQTQPSISLEKPRSNNDCYQRYPKETLPSTTQQFPLQLLHSDYSQKYSKLVLSYEISRASHINCDQKYLEQTGIIQDPALKKELHTRHQEGALSSKSNKFIPPAPSNKNHCISYSKKTQFVKSIAHQNCTNNAFQSHKSVCDPCRGREISSAMDNSTGVKDSNKENKYESLSQNLYVSEGSLELNGIDKNDKTENSGSQLLFSQDNHTCYEDLKEQNIKSSKSSQYELLVPAILPTTDHNLSSKYLKCREKNDSRTSEQENSTKSSKQKESEDGCMISNRLVEHKKIRQEVKEDKVALGKRCNKTINQYFIPYKRMKEDQTVEKGETLTTNGIAVGKSSSEMFIRDKEGTAVVKSTSEMSVQDREKMFSLFLSAQEITMTLLYTDNSTQLREPSSQTKVLGICMRCFYEMKTHTIVIPISEENLEVLAQTQTFLLELLKGGERKVCCFAKDAIIIILRYLKLTENSHDDLMKTSILDPVVAGWLLDPDNPPLTFDDLLESNGIKQKVKHNTDTECMEGDLNLSSEVMEGDLSLLSELMERQCQKLHSKDLWNLFICVETKLIPLLAILDTRKIKVDTKSLLRFSDVLKRQQDNLEKKAHTIVGHSFLLSSPAQLRQVLFEELQLHTKLPQTKIAKTNINHKMSTSETVLTQLTSVHPLPAVILEYRQIQKLKSTYVDGMISSVKDGYISTHWDQTSAATGRLSSYQPNLQAIPKSSLTVTDSKEESIIGMEREPSTVEIFARDCFISHEGYSFLAADFQQVELRLLAHLTGDYTLIKIFDTSINSDIFVELTSQWLNKNSTVVTYAEREQTKRIVYSVMYGAGKEKLAEYLKVSPNDAKAIIDSFLVRFPAINQFSRKCVEFCKKNGYTETIFKRKRKIPNISHPSPQLRAQAERKAVNFCVQGKEHSGIYHMSLQLRAQAGKKDVNLVCVQGSAADLCKAAMLQVEHALLQHLDIKSKLLVQIHDELLFEVKDEHLLKCASIVKRGMEDDNMLCGNMLKLQVPIKVSLSSGKSWGHMSAIEGI